MRHDPRPIIPGMKYCPGCGDYRPASEFWRAQYKPLGLRTYCKTHSAEHTGRRKQSIYT